MTANLSRENAGDSTVRMIRESLIAVIGESPARALDFYVDPHIAIADSAEYTKMLKVVFGGGAEVLMGKIAEVLYRKMGIEPVAGGTLADCIRFLKTMR